MTTNLHELSADLVGDSAFMDIVVYRVIESGITRVVIGTLDPNPLVNGRGANMLREHAIAEFHL